MATLQDYTNRWNTFADSQGVPRDMFDVYFSDNESAIRNMEAAQGAFAKSLSPQERQEYSQLAEASNSGLHNTMNKYVKPLVKAAALSVPAIGAGGALGLINSGYGGAGSLSTGIGGSAAPGGFVDAMGGMGEAFGGALPSPVAGSGAASTLPAWNTGAGGLFGSQAAIDGSIAAAGGGIAAPSIGGGASAGGALGGLSSAGDWTGSLGNIAGAAGGGGGSWLDAIGGAKGLAGLAGTVGGAYLQSNAADKAADAQAQASQQALALQKQMYDETVARNAPFVSGGTTAFNTLLDRLGLSGNTQAEGYNSFGKVPTAQDVMQEPGYQFGLDQGQKQIDRTTNMRGMRYSGAALKAANQYGNDYASGQYNNAFNRSQQAQQQAYNQLSGVANTGQASANNTSAYGRDYANAATNAYGNTADANSYKAINNGNIWNNALNQGISYYTSPKP